MQKVELKQSFRAAIENFPVLFATLPMITGVTAILVVVAGIYLELSNHIIFALSSAAILVVFVILYATIWCASLILRRRGLLSSNAFGLHGFRGMLAFGIGYLALSSAAILLSQSFMGVSLSYGWIAALVFRQ